MGFYCVTTDVLCKGVIRESIQGLPNEGERCAQINGDLLIEQSIPLKATHLTQDLKLIGELLKTCKVLSVTRTERLNERGCRV